MRDLRRDSRPVFETTIYDYEPRDGIYDPLNTTHHVCSSSSFTTYDLEPTIHDLEPTIHDFEPTTRDLELTTRDLEPTTRNVEPTTYDLETTIHDHDHDCGHAGLLDTTYDLRGCGRLSIHNLDGP
jgi:hypothetical protein